MSTEQASERIKNAQPGDVYEIPIDGKTKAYAQFLMLDLESLNSEILRVFEKRYAMGDKVDLAEVVKDKVAFLVHTVIRNGVKDGILTKVGNVELEDFELPYFRNDRSMDRWYPGKVSDEWHVWKTGEYAKKVGKLTPEYRKLDIGDVFPPSDIVYRLKHGKSEVVEAD